MRARTALRHSSRPQNEHYRTGNKAQQGESGAERGTEPDSGKGGEPKKTEKQRKYICLHNVLKLALLFT